MMAESYFYTRLFRWLVWSFPVGPDRNSVFPPKSETPPLGRPFKQSSQMRKVERLLPNFGQAVNMEPWPMVTSAFSVEGAFFRGFNGTPKRNPTSLESPPKRQAQLVSRTVPLKTP